MITYLKKSIAVLLIITVLFLRTLPIGYAEELQAQPTLEPAPAQQPAQPSEPNTNNTQQPNNPSDPTQSSTSPSQPVQPSGAPELQKAPELQSINPSPTPAQTQTNGANAGTQANGQNGGATVNTGNATSNNSIANNGNLNAATGQTGNAGGSAVVNDGNGANSSNSANSNSSSTTNTNQNNGAQLVNGINAATVTGENSTSFNVGDSSIKTGDANVTGTAISSVNTNLDGVMVSEFNIEDVHRGDLVLDFNANCISGCANGQNIASNTNNGAGSTNNTNTNTSNTNNTNQNNSAKIGSTLNLSADSGKNTASFNTAGDSNITTGNANVEANVLNFANNNFAGNVVLGVVNIFGTLIGDIVLTPEAMEAACGASCVNGSTAQNSGNGAGSTNNANANSSNNDATFQNNDASIGNSLVFDANTGKNSSSFNTDGSSSIKSGDSSVDANVLNVANNNVDGGNVWLVLVNQAGKWLGKIIGAPEGSQFSGSDTIEFDVNDNGDVSASNAGNGANSSNNASANESNNSTTTQNNDADIENNLNLSANTGNNTTSYNTGGKSDIKTGDAKIVANIVNFVNNNIKTGGKLIVTVVNVFGKWIGDFVGPNQHKETASNNNNAVGGPATSQVNIVTVPSITPQPTVAVISYAKTGSVQGASTSYTPSITTIHTNQPKQQILVKNASYNALVDDMNGKNVININLAWLVLLLPFAGLTYISKNFLLRFIRRK